MTRRRKGASDSCFYYKWLDKALCDLQAARLLLTYGGDHYNIAFHCQQAIEKALKGYLLFRTGRHFDGHNLTYLCRQAIQLDSKAFSEYLDESAALNDLYIETRYPTDLPFEIDELEVRRYLDMAERMFAAIRQQLYEGAAQGELPEGQKKVPPLGIPVPRNSFVGCSLCIPSNFTFIFHSPVSIFNLVLFTLNSPLFTLYKTPISSLLTPTLRNLSHLDTCILRQLLLSYKDVRSD